VTNSASHGSESKDGMFRTRAGRHMNLPSAIKSVKYYGSIHATMGVIGITTWCFCEVAMQGENWQRF
jgi:hypothetical protein